MAHQLFQLPKATAISANLTLVAGAKVEFFLTGTTTPTPVYQDSGLTTPHTNPVVADAAGRLPPVYLDPSIVHKATFSDSADVLIYTADPVNDQLLSQAIIGGYLYPITQAEIDALVTPVNYAYEPLPEIDGRRLGFVGDDSTNNDTALADAIAVLGLVTVNGGILRLPAGTYRFATGISLPIGMCIAGTSYRSTILKYTGSGTAITIAGSISQCALRDIQLQGTSKTGTGIQLGTTDFCNMNFFERVWVTAFSTGVRLGATFNNTFKDCRISGNVVGVDFNASFATGATNATSFYGCYIASNDRNGVDASSVPVRNVGIGFYNCTVENNCNSAPSTYPQFYLSEVQNFHLSACYFEYALGGTPPDAIKADGLSNGRIDACYFNTYATAIRDVAGTSVSDVVISGCRSAGGVTKSIDLTNETRVVIELSNLWDSSVTLTGTDCKQYTKPAAEQLISDTSWTPVLIGSTGAGTPTYTVQAAYYSRVGNLIFIRGRITISAKTGMTGNLQISGLPVTSGNQTNGSFLIELICSGITNTASYTEFMGHIAPNVTVMDIYEAGSNVNEAPVPLTNVAAATTVRFSGVYSV